MSKSESLIFIGMDVHQDTVSFGGLRGSEARRRLLCRSCPTICCKLRRFFDRWAKRGEIRTCYEASGAG